MKLLKLTLVLAILGGLLVTAAISEKPPRPRREDLKKQFEAGNFKVAYDGLRQLALDPADDPRLVGDDLNLATSALQQLGRVDEIDDFREAVIKVHSRNWRLLQAAAENYLAYENYGFIVAGKFYRGQHRGGGQAVNSMERDRVRALQLMTAAIPLTVVEPAHNDVANFYLSFSRLLLSNRGYDEAWRLQTLTDLGQLPDYDEGFYYGHPGGGAPVGADGNPVFYHVPKSLAKAANDGERWRWALAQAVEYAPERRNEVRWLLADFLQNQFGVQTMAYYGRFFSSLEEDDGKKDESGTYALHTLADDETIARLATGIKRFKLPDEFNFIKLYEQIAAEPKTGYGAESLEQLAQVYENRRQYDRAADYWRHVIKEYGPGNDNYRQQRLDQIIGNWGRFEPIMTQPAGKGATVEFRFRNGDKVSFEAHEIKVDKLLADVKAYLKANPKELDWQKVNVADVGYRLVTENQSQYVGEKVAAWDLPLKPREHHFDRRVTVATPLQKAGAYLLTAKMADGNSSHVVIWLDDTAIVMKPLDGGTFYYVADAVSGEPIAKANLEFFGYRQKPIPNSNQFDLETANFAEFTDADGQLIRKAKAGEQEFQWLITATTPAGRFAYLGFSKVWSDPYYAYYDAEYNETKVFTITDRPVYRPGNKVKFKFWVRHAKYDQENTSEFANQNFTVEILDPKGEKVLSKPFTADAYGGLDGEFPLPADATLGVYQLMVVNHGGGSFRVEEYKKPEYEVNVEAPTEPVMLGEKITARIKAKYYFGSPVIKARVHYTIQRTNYSDEWYPPGDWDWLYEPGYWWFAGDYPWYPGWPEWGCKRPIAWWWGRGQNPPEVVADRQVEIGADGTVAVEIDTAVAKLVHPDEDHQYTITAEVVDESRRTIVGTGNVLVARKPFKVFAWVDRGHYRVGDVVRADFFAQTLDAKPIAGDGKLSLLKITYKDDKPVETSVRDWDLATDAQGRATMQIKASEAGQYRLSYKVTDAKKHTIEGGYLFTIMGEGFDGADFRFNNLELIPDKREYAPGQSVNLQVNTDRAGATVLLFVRPANGVYLKPLVKRMKDKSFVEEIAVTQKDMPNFFVEADTISGGKLYTETREIIVPPEQRVLNVAVQPSRDTYKPGQRATVAIKLTDLSGKPFVGSTVAAIYDKAVEYVSGGSNVPEIKAFFWKWRRSHSPVAECSLNRWFANLVKPKESWMQDVGVFGEGSIEETDGQKPVVEAELSSYGTPTSGVVGHGTLELDAAAASPPAPDAAKMPEQKSAGPAGPPMVQPTVRTNFADTALWVGSLATNEKGEAEVALDMPENLTTWKVKVWGMGHGTKVGQGDAEVVTRKDLIVRLQAPRFFVEKDEVVLSANVHNYLKTKKKVQVVLELAGRSLTLRVENPDPSSKEPAAPSNNTQEIEVPAGGETRVDWRVKVVREGEATIRMKALTDEESDAVEQKFPVYVHGMLKMDSYSGALRPADESGRITINVPAQRREGQSQLEVRYSPTLAGAMVDALPYLADYPYGCTEQTLNRFLPTVVTQRVLVRMGLDLKKIQEKRTNLNAQEIGDDKQRAAGWKRFDRNPVFDNDEVRRMVQDGVQRLTQMQNADGGWGWFSGFGEQSWPHTTAVVVHGLQLARQNDVALVPGMLERGTDWLKHYQEQQVQLLNNALTKPKPTEPYKTEADNLDAFVYMVLVDGGLDNAQMRDFLYRDRVHLAVYAKALFGLALEKQGQKEKLAMILKNIEQFVVQDNEDQTAYLKLPDDNYWWTWYGSDIEADAYYLKLLTRTDPKGAVAPRLVKYLLNNRKHATYWNSTRDTSLAIEALAEYLKASGEDKPDLTVEVWLDGKQQKEVKITAADLFTFDNRFVLNGDGVTTGRHVIELRKKGTGPLYYNAYLTIFTLEDSISRAGLEVKVNRKVYKLVRDDKTVAVAGSRGQAVDQRVEKYRRVELKDLDTLKSGDLVEVELEIDSKNDYEYLVFEDMKAAGFEAVEQRSGYGGNAMNAYMELRDNRVSFFVRELARGKHSVAYRLRAEIPGRFSALPARASAMYAPELKGNSDEIKLQIED